MDYKKLGLLLLINLAIAMGFFYDNRNAEVGAISSDLANIIPVCLKLDQPNLFQGDLYLSDVNDVKYYTPFFVQSLRGLAVWTHGDYLQALNWLGFLTHFCYGICWFFLFYTLRRDYVLALVFSIFFRGILWPPGGELLGISQLWTIMPRTVFIALAPLPLLAFYGLPKYKMMVSGLLLGLILNFHPISGIGLIICYFAAFVAYSWFSKRRLDQAFFKDFCVFGVCVLLGMLPYVLTYLSNIKMDMQYSKELYQQAFYHRISPTFSNPGLFILQWNRPIMLLLLVTFGMYWFFDTSVKKRNFYTLLTAIAVLFVVSNGFEYLERSVNSLLHKNIRMAFQLIRMQKLMLVLLQVGLYLLLCDVVMRYRISQKIKNSLAVCFLVLVSCATMPLFAKVPFVGDDLITSIFPEALHVYQKPYDSHAKDRGDLMRYIKMHTPADAIFYGSFYIRAGAERAVVLDGKGASMLIEGDQNKFVKWYLDVREMEQLPAAQLPAFLKSKKVSYFYTNEPQPHLKLVKKIGYDYLYAL